METDTYSNIYTLSLFLSLTHTHTDGLMEAFIDWATGQREDTAVEKYLPK